MHCSGSDGRGLFDKYWLYLIDDMHRRIVNSLGNPSFVIPNEQLVNLRIQKLTDLFGDSGGNINNYGLPKLTSWDYGVTDTRLINDELDPEPLMLSIHASSLNSQLNSGQKNVFDTITGCALGNSPGFFFVCGHGGTGKTFLLGVSENQDKIPEHERENNKHVQAQR
jgi:hypothetical protein